MSDEKEQAEARQAYLEEKRRWDEMRERVLTGKQTSEDLNYLKTFMDPHKSEKQLLRAAMAGGPLAARLLHAVQPEEFLEARHRALWSALQALNRKGNPYARTEALAIIGLEGSDLLDELEALPVPTRLRYHLRYVLSRHALAESIQYVEEGKIPPRVGFLLARAFSSFQWCR